MTFVNVTVKRWVDGDTVYLTAIDLGFYIKLDSLDFRLARINTPEKGQPGYDEAIAEVNRLAPPGTKLSIECLGKDKYGRWLAELTTPEGININQHMLDAKLAVPYK